MKRLDDQRELLHGTLTLLTIMALCSAIVGLILQPEFETLNAFLTIITIIFGSIKVRMGKGGNTIDTIVGTVCILVCIPLLMFVAIRTYHAIPSAIPSSTTIPVVEPVLPSPRDNYPRIAVATFEDRSDGAVSGVDPAGYIYAELKRRIEGSNLELELVKLDKIIHENAALEVAKKYGCTILIYGWYDKININPFMEKINTSRCEPAGEVQSLQSLRISSNEDLSLNIATNLPEQASYLTLFILASERYENNRRDEALIYLDEALNKYGECSSTFDTSDGFRLRGDIYRITGQFDLAIKNYNCSIQQDESEPRSFQGRGNTFAYKQLSADAKKDYDNAILLYTKQLEVNPNDYDSWRNRGFTYIATQEYAKAIDDFQKALDLRPESGAAYRDLGYSYRLSKRFDEAVNTLLKAVSICTQDWDAYTNLGLAYLERDDSSKRDLDSAYRAFSKAIESYSDYAPARKSRGFLLIRMNRAQLAVDDFQKLIETNPNDPVAYRDLGYALRLSGQFDSSITQLSIALELMAEDADTLLNRGRAYKAKNDVDMARRDFEEALRYSQPESWVYKAANEELLTLK